MDISLLRDRARVLKHLLSAITSFQKNSAHPTTDPETIKLGRGIALAIIAILLGWMSKAETENMTRNKTLISEWPSPKIWHSVLSQGGWVQNSNGDLSSILKNHPDPFSNQPMVWETENHCYILITQSTEPEIWSCASGYNEQKQKLRWHKIGSGYEGVNQLAQIVVPKPKKTPSYIDPKEIRY